MKTFESQANEKLESEFEDFKENTYIEIRIGYARKGSTALLLSLERDRAKAISSINLRNPGKKYLSILERQLKDENSSLREQLREIDESTATNSSCFSDASSSISSNSYTITDKDSLESGSSEYNSIKLQNKISQNEDRDRLHEKIKDLEDELAKKTEEFSQLEVSFQGK